MNEYCSGCDRPGRPYTYRGIEFSGLTTCHSELLCSSCLDSFTHHSGVDVKFSHFGQEDVVNTKDMINLFPGSRFGFHIQLKGKRK